ncbi:hypothetical protein [Henriciella pelagia]|uniref:hypothetical protein n=1 Tax=Henriciella pelagia TaxID=1977912 RepID=UPI003514F685
MTLEEVLERLTALPPEEQKAAIKIAEQGTRGMVIVPNPGPQTMAYHSKADLLYYGGSAGGGKTILLLALAANEHRVSRLFRRHFKDIDGEGGMVEAMTDSLGSTKGYNSQKHSWKLPLSQTGGVPRSIEFGAFTNQKEAEAYQGRAADFLGFDEAVQFQEELIEFAMGWNRPAKGVPATQRCRVVLASNPPLTPEGMWIFDWFAPWLDPEYADPLNKGPAQPGELRWFAKINGITVEVEEDWVGHVTDAQGRQLEIHPKSRTFIPAALSDNPDLMDSDYANQLALLPEHLQDALLRGKFTTTLEDAERQVIPTAWILAAQERWMLRKNETDPGSPQYRPMTALGVDVSSGGADRMVLAPLHGTTFGKHVSKPGADVRTGNEKFSFVMSVARDDPQFNVDNNGYGDDICSSLENNEFNVRRIKASFGPTRKARDGREFENMRAQLVWAFREALDPVNGDNIALPPGRDILLELASFRETVREEMRKVIKIEPNEKIKERIGRSPDVAWSYLFAWAEPSAIAKEQRRTHVRRRRSRTSTAHVVHDGYAKAKGRR